nr:LamG domain-containing protein [Pseudoxanthomonas sp. LH2527]
MHFDGTDGATVFTDVKGRVWTAQNSARIETDYSKFGGASGWFENTPSIGSENGSRISTPDHADLRFGTGDWTVEGWFRPQTPVVGFGAFFRKGQNTTDGLQLAVMPGQLNLRANGTTDTTVGVSLSTSDFSHVAFVRDGGTVRFFVNGTQVGSASRSFNHTSTDPLLLGSVTGDARYAYKGMMDDLRITKGVARYTANFPPPTAPFPNS